MTPRFELLNVDRIGQQVREQLGLSVPAQNRQLSTQVGELVEQANTTLHSTADEMTIFRECPDGTREVIIQKNVVWYGNHSR